jgi:hypothetical protein
MQVTRERRSAPRKQVNLAVLCKSGEQRGAGQMVNVSLSGALVEPASIRPEQGAIVKILFTTPGARRATDLNGTVARRTETGFAIQFLAASDALREFVAEAA